MLHALLNDFGLHVNQYTPGMETGGFVLSFGWGEITFKRDSALTLGTVVLQSPSCQVGKQCVVENTTQLIATLAELHGDARHEDGLCAPPPRANSEGSAVSKVYSMTQ